MSSLSDEETQESDTLKQRVPPRRTRTPIETSDDIQSAVSPELNVADFINQQPATRPKQTITSDIFAMQTQNVATPLPQNIATSHITLTAP